MKSHEMRPQFLCYHNPHPNSWCDSVQLKINLRVKIYVLPSLVPVSHLDLLIVTFQCLVLYIQVFFIGKQPPAVPLFPKSCKKIVSSKEEESPAVEMGNEPLPWLWDPSSVTMFLALH